MLGSDLAEGLLDAGRADVRLDAAVPSAAAASAVEPYVKANRMRDELVVSDLRMGAEPDYSFRFVVARAGPGGWNAIPPRQLRWPWSASRRLPAVWNRIWETPTGEEAR